MYLLPDGIKVIIEMRDGNSVEIRSTSIFEPKKISSKWDTRLDFGYGANVYLFMRGNPMIYDQLIL